MKMLDDEIGKRIAILRKACSVSAKDLSLAIGKKSNYIQRLEKGYFKPSAAPFFDICEHLGISPLILISTSVEELEKIVEMSKMFDALDENQKERVMENFCSLVEQRIAEALENSEIE